MKNMEYKSNFCGPVILDEGNIDGLDYVIVSFGVYPAARVRIPESHKFYGETNLKKMDIQCHGGGLRFADDYLSYLDNSDGWWIGWNYDHDGDYGLRYDGRVRGGIRVIDGKQWTTEEILEEVKNVIKQLNSYRIAKK